MVPRTVVAVVVIVPVVMVPVVIVPVVGSPGAPVGRVVSPVPGGPPDHVTRTIHPPDHRPVSDIIIGGGHDIHSPHVGLSRVPGIRGLGVDRLNDVIWTVEGLVPDQLDLYRSVPQLLNHEHSYILLIVAVQLSAKDDGVYLSLGIIGNRDVIDVVVAVQVQVVDHGLLVVQAPFECFQCLGFLEQVHHGIQVQVVSRQTQVFIRVILC
jgi:hypothetical protein